MTAIRSDVVVIGAGFAGLSAARALRRAGYEVVVIEGRDRVGGRTHTSYLADGTQIDLGGQWLGPTQDRMYALAAEFGVDTFPTAAHGRPVYQFGTEVRDELTPAVGKLLERIDDLAATVDLEQPWAGVDAPHLDATTVQSWAGAQDIGDPHERDLLGRITAGNLQTVEAADASLLGLLFYVRSGHGTASLLGMAGGAQQDRLVGGPAAIAQRLAASLGDAVHLGQRVRRISWDREVTVETDTDRIHARRAVVTVPASLVPEIEFSPVLPATKYAALRGLLPGVGMKVHLVYPEPFWRADGLSGQTTHSDGCVTETVDNSVPGDPRGVLTAFAYGHDARALRRLDPVARRTAVMDALEPVLGRAVRTAEEFVEFDWAAEPLTRGCFSARYPTGGWTGVGPDLRGAVGPLHWAGTEYATVWNGYFEGAVGSGLRTADEVVAELS